jgi:hypothetical protein
MTRLLLVGAALAGGVAIAAPPRANRPVPFKVGETLTYAVSWSSYLTAGTATAQVAATTPAPASYVIVAEGRPISLVARLYPLYYRIETRLDSATLLSRGGSVYSEEGSRKRTRTTTIDRAAQPLAQDSLSALYALRAASLRTGLRLNVPVVDNAVTYAATLAVGAPETVRSGIGDVPAWRIAVTALDPAGVPAGRNMALWISTDSRRLPVKLQADLAIGSMTLLLSGAK